MTDFKATLFMRCLNSVRRQSNKFHSQISDYDKSLRSSKCLIYDGNCWGLLMKCSWERQERLNGRIFKAYSISVSHSRTSKVDRNNKQPRYLHSWRDWLIISWTLWSCYAKMHTFLCAAIVEGLELSQTFEGRGLTYQVLRGAVCLRHVPFDEFF